MKVLLNITTQRHLALLEMLYYNKKWFPLKEVSTTLNCSESIIRKDVEQINIHFAPFKIMHRSKTGIMLDIPAEMTVEYIYQTILTTSLEFTLLETLFFNPKMNVSMLAETLFISQSTLARTITRCNKTLRSWHIHISSAPHSIVGDELQIRSFFTHFFQEKYSLVNSPLSPEITSGFQHLLLTQLEPLGIKLKFSEIELLTFMFLTICTRVKFGMLLSFPNDDVKNHPWIDLFLSDKTFSLLFKKEFKRSWNAVIIEQIFYPFLKDTFFFSITELDLAADLSKDIQQRLDRIKSLINSLSTKIATPIPNKKALVLILYNYHLFFIGNNHVLFDKRKNYVLTLSEEYPQIVSVMKQTLLDFQFHDNFEWSEATLNEAIYLLTTNWENFITSIHKKLPFISILISCTFEHQHAQLLEQLLDLRVTNNTKITISQAQTIPEHLEELDDYDLVLINTDKIKSNHPHLLCINPLPIFRDWLKVRNSLISLIEEKSQKLVN